MNGEETQKDFSFVDSAIGGEDHSQPTDSKDDGKTVEAQQQPAANAPEPQNGNPPFGEEDSGFEQTKPAATEPEPEQKKDDAAKAQEEELTRLRQENETLSKRLHDTQKAYHQKSEEIKKLDELREKKDKLDKKKSDDDDWFSDADEKELKTVTDDLEAQKRRVQDLDVQVEHTDRDQNLKEWERLCAPLRAEHKDFDDVIDYIGNLVVEGSGKTNAAVKARYDAMQDKSPKAVYELGLRIRREEEFSRDPDAYEKRIRESVLKEHESKEPPVPRGKQGLDMVNSAIQDPSSRQEPKGFVDSLF